MKKSGPWFARAGVVLALASMLCACGGGGGGDSAGTADSPSAPSSPAGPRPGAVDPADVMFGFDPTRGLDGQNPGMAYDAAGRNVASAVAGAAINFNGEPRISVVQDPQDATRLVLRLMQRPSDPTIGGQPRTELNYYPARPAATPPRGAWFWRAWQLYLPQWNATNATYIIAQIHSTEGVNPPLTLGIRGSRFVATARSATAQPMRASDQVERLSRSIGAVSIGSWMTIVQRIRLDPNDGGVQTWIDGRLALDYKGPLGYSAGEHYVKQGLYPLDSNVSQEVLLRGPWLLRDAGYDESLLREWVAAR